MKRCQFCGNKINGNALFCPHCGTDLRTNITKTKILICKRCGGTMDVTDERQVLYCPYCGSKELLIESDKVKIEKYRADVQLEAVRDRNRTEKEITISKEKHDAFITIIPFSILLLAMIVMIIAFSWRDVNVAKKVTNGEAILASCKSYELEGMPYDDVIAILQADGFKNIITIKEDVGFWDADKVGTVKEVKINGENMWTDEPYSLDSKVKVTYYCND